MKQEDLRLKVKDLRDIIINLQRIKLYYFKKYILKKIQVL